MSITITLGKSGRLVVPKAIRDSLGLHEGSRLQLNVQGGRIEAVPEADEVRIELKDGFPVIQGGPALKGGDVVRALKAEREARDERILPQLPHETEMKSAIDSSVIVAALNGSDPDHVACHRLLLAGKHSIHAHALSETFSILTGGRLGIRVPPQLAATILREQVAMRLDAVLLTETDLLDACAETESRGIRGGAIYDYLHLVAARKAGAVRFYTLNLSDFQSFHRPGDPEIAHP